MRYWVYQINKKQRWKIWCLFVIPRLFTEKGFVLERNVITLSVKYCLAKTALLFYLPPYYYFSEPSRHKIEYERQRRPDYGHIGNIVVSDPKQIFVVPAADNVGQNTNT